MWKYILVLGFAFVGCNSDVESEDVIKPYFDTVTFMVQAEKLRDTVDVKECMKLEVTEADILSVIAQSKRTGGPEWHYSHVYPPCRHVGQINYKGDIHSFKFYPTGYLSLEGYDGWFMCYDCSVHPDWVIFDGHGEE